MQSESLAERLTFGFETTFTLPNWWQSPGFCSECETEEKTELMRKFSALLAQKLAMPTVPITDAYGFHGFEIRNEAGAMIFRFTPEPGSIEVNTPPVLLKDIISMVTPLLECAEAVGLVPYRRWWYGIQTGTGGGCHLNMAGFTSETNPFKNDLGLVLKYFAFFHNHPSLHYPFMGPDLGQGGNCMRMDEQGEKSETNLQRFQEAVTRYNSGWRPKNEELYEFFKDVPLREVKHSAPTLRKMTAPFYLVEDRAVEMPRTAQEFFILSELRLCILARLQKAPEAEIPRKFGPELHHEMISYATLWQEFQGIAETLSLSPEPYRVFFERQFPQLQAGEEVPKSFFLREGKRERRVSGIHEIQGSLVMSKKIDSRYKRFEIHETVPQASIFRMNGKRVPAHSDGLLLDLFVPQASPASPRALLDIELSDPQGRFIERAIFDLSLMQYVPIPENRFWVFADLPARRYHDLEDDLDFTLK